MHLVHSFSSPTAKSYLKQLMRYPSEVSYKGALMSDAHKREIETALRTNTDGDIVKITFDGQTKFFTAFDAGVLLAQREFLKYPALKTLKEYQLTHLITIDSKNPPKEGKMGQLLIDTDTSVVLAKTTMKLWEAHCILEQERFKARLSVDPKGSDLSSFWLYDPSKNKDVSTNIKMTKTVEAALALLAEMAKSSYAGSPKSSKARLGRKESNESLALSKSPKTPKSTLRKVNSREAVALAVQEVVFTFNEPT